MYTLYYGVAEAIFYTHEGLVSNPLRKWTVKKFSFFRLSINRACKQNPCQSHLVTQLYNDIPTFVSDILHAVVDVLQVYTLMEITIYPYFITHIQLAIL